MTWNPFARIRKLERHAREMQAELENLRNQLAHRRVLSWLAGDSEISLADLDKRLHGVENWLRAEAAKEAGKEVMSNWQPIETAPKDGTEILGFREDAGVFIVRWCNCYDFMTDAECDETEMNDDQLSEPDWFYADFIKGGRLDGDLAPTHWQPLPEPPEPES